MSVTDADRAVANGFAKEHQSWCHWEVHADCCGTSAQWSENDDCDCGLFDMRDALAAALAFEREKARAPFLALADGIADKQADELPYNIGYVRALKDAADLIRHIAEADQ